MELAFYCILALCVTGITMAGIVAIFCYKHDELSINTRSRIRTQENNLSGEVALGIDSTKNAKKNR